MTCEASTKRGRPKKRVETTIVKQKPREKQSFRDFYPDLDIKEPLSIVKIDEPVYILLSTFEDNSPSNDEYETASEGEFKANIPIASFQKVHENHNLIEKFSRPAQYIRYTEPSETELFNTIEYDMDEQDEIWLTIYNNERKKESLGQVSCELFEAIIDKLEKEWFNLVKNLPKIITEEPLVSEDSKCAVCDDGECENSNAIVFCDGCNLAVHQDCYGIPYIPEGQWLCKKCMVSPESSVSCIFCPFKDGAFKQTTSKQWGHLLCAVWIPELTLTDSIYMEPIENVDNIPKSRWKLVCYICRRRHGACIQCDNKSCFTAFHVTCARWARLCMRMKLNNSHYDDVLLKAYCERHTPSDYKDTVDVDTLVIAAQKWFSNPKHKRLTPITRYVDEKETPLQSVKQKKQEIPIAPEYIIDKLENLSCVVQATGLKKKSTLITSICRYWSLKREARRGAPLLKRLQLESWSASQEAELEQKATFLKSLREDLEKSRIVSEQVLNRERQKLETAQKQKAYLESILYPIECTLKLILDQLIALDKNKFFRYPVTLDIAPDYLDIIKHPMSFEDVLNKLALHKYWTIDDFETDLLLIWKNCKTYNKSDTQYYKSAQRLESITKTLITNARTPNEIKQQSDLVKVETPTNNFVKRKLGEDESTESTKKRCLTSIYAKKIVTRSTSEQNKRSLRSRSIEVQPIMKKQTAVKIKNSDPVSQRSIFSALCNKKLEQCSTNNVPKQEKLHQHVYSEQNKHQDDVKNQTIIESVDCDVQNQISIEPVDKDVQNSGSIEAATILTDLQHRPSLDIIENDSESEMMVEMTEKKELVQTIEENIVEYNDNSVAVHDVQNKETEQVSTIIQNKPNQDTCIHESTQSNKTLENSIETTLIESSPKDNIPESTENCNIKEPESIDTLPPQNDSTPTVKFIDQEIVWARVPTFPSHPGTIFDQTVSKKSIPKNILKAKPSKEAILVKFFLVGESHTWGWIEKSDIHAFGHFSIDTGMLAQAKKTKKSRRIKEVKNAYKHVCKLLNIDPEIALSLVFQVKKKKKVNCT